MNRKLRKALGPNSTTATRFVVRLLVLRHLRAASAPVATRAQQHTAGRRPVAQTLFTTFHAHFHSTKRRPRDRIENVGAFDAAPITSASRRPKGSGT